jgi:hypothetical protein
MNSADIITSLSVVLIAAGCSTVRQARVPSRMQAPVRRLEAPTHSSSTNHDRSRDARGSSFDELMSGALARTVRGEPVESEPPYRSRTPSLALWTWEKEPRLRSTIETPMASCTMSCYRRGKGSLTGTRSRTSHRTQSFRLVGFGLSMATVERLRRGGKSSKRAFHDEGVAVATRVADVARQRGQLRPWPLLGILPTLSWCLEQRGARGDLGARQKVLADLSLEVGCFRESPRRRV